MKITASAFPVKTIQVAISLEVKDGNPQHLTATQRPLISAEEYFASCIISSAFRIFGDLIYLCLLAVNAIWLQALESGGR